MKHCFRMTIAAAAVAFLGADLHAAGLSRHKDWASSPEAYFLTKGERAKWAEVTTDEAAEAFIARYRSVRGQGFAAAIQSRIDYANKNLALGKRKGSETLRGRTLIVLGPPTRVEKGHMASEKTKFDPSGSENTTGADTGNGVGNSLSNVGGPGADTLRGMKPVENVVTWSWVYDGTNIPPTVTAKQMVLEFVVEPDNNKESARDPEKLSQMLDAVVEYWKPKQ